MEELDASSSAPSVSRWLARSPTPLFVGPIEPWLVHRQALIDRCAAWTAANGRDPPLSAEAPEVVGGLFPPPAFSEALVAGSRWRPAGVGEVGSVVVTIGGIYGGFDGPAGLFDYMAAVLPDVSFLQLDGGHSINVASAVLHAGLRWLLAAHPQAQGRVVLCGFSMGAAVAMDVGARLLSSVHGLLSVAAPTGGAEHLRLFTGKPVLVVHGEADQTVPARCAEIVAKVGEAGGASVQLEVFPQKPYGKEEGLLGTFRRHHLWDERWDVQAVVLEWLRAQLRALEQRQQQQPLLSGGC